MFSKISYSAALIMAIVGIARAQDVAASRSSGQAVLGKHARMTIVTEPTGPRATSHLKDAGLVTIFNNLASKYPKGQYWCCTGYNVMGLSEGEQWMAAAFTPAADHTVTTIE